MFKRVKKANINSKFPDISTYKDIDLMIKVWNKYYYRQFNL